MADLKISQLTNYTTPLDADELPIVDKANVITKKITYANLVNFPYAIVSNSATLTSGGTTTANLVTFDTDVYKNKITHSTVTNPSRITVDEAGAYLITFSAVVNASVANKHIDIWLRKDGTNVAGSNTHYETPLSGEGLCTVTFIEQLTANQYIELVWASKDDASFVLLATAAGASPTTPASPSVILTINKISD